MICASELKVITVLKWQQFDGCFPRMPTHTDRGFGRGNEIENWEKGSSYFNNWLLNQSLDLPLPLPYFCPISPSGGSKMFKDSSTFMHACMQIAELVVYCYPILLCSLCIHQPTHTRTSRFPTSNFLCLVFYLVKWAWFCMLLNF